MSKERNAMTLFEEANPVPDPNVFRVDVPNATTYLASLDKESEVVQTDNVETRQEGTRRWLFAAAAAIVVVLGAAWVLTRSGEAPIPPAVVPTTTTTTTTSITDAAIDPTGYWVVDEVRQLALVADGTYYWVTVGRTTDEGTWRISNDRLIVTSGPDSATCDEGATGSHALLMPDTETLTLIFSTDDCDAERDLAPLAGTRRFSRTEPFELP